MKRPGLLYADAAGGLTDCEGLSGAAVLALDHGSLKDLDPLTVSFLDQIVYTDSIAYAELRYLLLQLLPSI